MRYERMQEVMELAVRLQGARGGLTLDDIQEAFAISRRTAERRRDVVDAVFGPLTLVDQDDGKRHWRLGSDALRRLISVSAQDLAAVQAAALALERDGRAEPAAALQGFAVKLRATVRAESQERLESDLEVLAQAEGFAMRPGPSECLDAELLGLLREAITTRQLVEFHYLSQSTGRRRRQLVRPLGLLYGNRAFLVAAKASGEAVPWLWRLGNVSGARLTGETFERDPAFNLGGFAERSFGTFQERPVNVALRFDARVARDAAAFRFHPRQTVTPNDDGSLTVRFRAGGIDEMCWHLVTWGESVTVERPVRLRRRLQRLCATLAAHHSGAGAG